MDLGSAHLRGSRFGGVKRLVGITTVFSGDGKYRVSNISKAAERQNYGAALLDSLRETVSRIKTEMNWQTNDHVRLVFHAFKPIKNIEADAVKTVMSELGDFDLDYAFLHVAEHHPFLLFDHSQKGVFDYETKQSKGILAPTFARIITLTLFMLVSPEIKVLSVQEKKAAYFSANGSRSGNNSCSSHGFLSFVGKFVGFLNLAERGGEFLAFIKYP